MLRSRLNDPTLRELEQVVLADKGTFPSARLQRLLNALRQIDARLTEHAKLTQVSPGGAKRP